MSAVWHTGCGSMESGQRRSGSGPELQEAISGPTLWMLGSATCPGRPPPEAQQAKQAQQARKTKHFLLRIMFRMLRMLLRISTKKNQANSILWRMLRTLRTLQEAGKSSVRTAVSDD